MKIYFHTPSFSFSFHAHREGRRAGVDSAACFSEHQRRIAPGSKALCASIQKSGIRVGAHLLVKDALIRSLKLI